MQLRIIKAVGFTCALLLLASCEKNYTPKHKGYFRIDFPEKEYKTFNNNCPFTFEYPVYAGVYHDSSENAEPCWLNVQYPGFNATLHITYKPIDTDSNKLEILTEQSRKYAYEHTIKAQDIVLHEIEDTTCKMFITTYNLEGETATSFRFYATDNKKHFLDGAFYFNHRTNIDSIAPVQEYLLNDINHMLETLQWK